MQGGMPPNVQVRGPGGPYYGGPMGPVPYPPGAYGMMEGDDQNFRGGRGGGRGRGRTGRGGRGRGRGGRGYNFQYHSGRGQNQNGPQGAQSSEGGEWQQPIGDDAGNAPQQTNASAEPVAPAPTPETQPAQT